MLFGEIVDGRRTCPVAILFPPEENPNARIFSEIMAFFHSHEIPMQYLPSADTLKLVALKRVLESCPPSVLEDVRKDPEVGPIDTLLAETPPDYIGRAFSLSGFARDLGIPGGPCGFSFAKFIEEIQCKHAEQRYKEDAGGQRKYLHQGQTEKRDYFNFQYLRGGSTADKRLLLAQWIIALTERQHIVEMKLLPPPHLSKTLYGALQAANRAEYRAPKILETIQGGDLICTPTHVLVGYNSLVFAYYSSDSYVEGNDSSVRFTLQFIAELAKHFKVELCNVKIIGIVLGRQAEFHIDTMIADLGGNAQQSSSGTPTRQMLVNDYRKILALSDDQLTALIEYAITLRWHVKPGAKDKDCRDASLAMKKAGSSREVEPADAFKRWHLASEHVELFKRLLHQKNIYNDEAAIQLSAAGFQVIRALMNLPIPRATNIVSSKHSQLGCKVNCSETFSAFCFQPAVTINQQGARIALYLGPASRNDRMKFPQTILDCQKTFEMELFKQGIQSHAITNDGNVIARLGGLRCLLGEVAVILAPSAPMVI